MAINYDFSIDRNTIINGALLKLGVLPMGGTATTAQYTQHAVDLNMLLKSWQGRGIDFWTDKTIYILPQANANVHGHFFQVNVSANSAYDSTTSSYHVVTSYDYTTTTAARTSGATTITVSTASNIASGDMIGVELVSGSSPIIHWTTVNGAPSGSTVTLTTALPANVDSGASVWTYTVSSQRAEMPIMLYDNVYHFDQTTGYKIPVNLKSYDEMLKLKTVQNSTVSNQISYMRSFVANGAGAFFIWPDLGDAGSCLIARVKYKVPVFFTNDEGLKYPEEMYETLVFNLAARLASTYGIPNEARMILKKEASDMLELLESNSAESGATSIRFSPSPY